MNFMQSTAAEARRQAGPFATPSLRRMRELRREVLHFCLSIAFAENRFPLFGAMP
jgi:hypothetical protein